MKDQERDDQRPGSSWEESEDAKREREDAAEAQLRPTDRETVTNSTGGARECLKEASSAEDPLGTWREDWCMPPEDVYKSATTQESCGSVYAIHRFHPPECASLGVRLLECQVSALNFGLLRGSRQWGHHVGHEGVRG
ncbi:hypothetical protein NDU88_006379 [Pleurodeles waltl]|uniref:Uncharacterized protein n=1 Tax=Pleurodeles waltl TaxID=8319 RepID=A0AAV7X1H7_PLEWA|nr:hypothetical protein NDU88_006379 [Pleurodeles waltl]